MRVCYFGTYREGYSRNRIMIEGLRRNGIEVVECHETLWQGEDDRLQAASGGWLRPGFLWRAARTYAHLLWRYCRIGAYDVLVVAYPGHIDVFPARLLSWLAGKPLVWDVVLSVYGVARERGLDKSSPRTVALLRKLEIAACRLPELLILDTPEYISWFGLTYQISTSRFRYVPIGADDRIFRPPKMTRRSHRAEYSPRRIGRLAPEPIGQSSFGLPKLATSPGNGVLLTEAPARSIVYAGGQGEKRRHFRVLYYGTFIPNHGVEHIVEAARLLSDDPSIEFEFVGRGLDHIKATSLVQRYGLTNVSFVDWLPQDELAKRVHAADVCLGAFGETPHSSITIHNKVYEGLAMAKPVITRDSPAVRAILNHREQVFLCPGADSRALADAIAALRDDPSLCQTLSRNGYRAFTKRFAPSHIGKRFSGYLRQVIALTNRG